MSDWREIFGDGIAVSLGMSDVLFRREDTIRNIYLVEAGAVTLERSLSDGSALTLKRTEAGALLAEASLFAKHYHCDAVANEPSQLLMPPKTTILERLEKFPGSALALLAGTSKEVQRLRARVEILRLKRVADRLDAWLQFFDPPEKGEWVGVAEAIGVTPSALYRELARRRETT